VIFLFSSNNIDFFITFIEKTSDCENNITIRHARQILQRLQVDSSLFQFKSTKSNIYLIYNNRKLDVINKRHSKDYAYDKKLLFAQCLALGLIPGIELPSD
jgi:hypothetical protein